MDFLDGIRGVAIAAVLALHWASWYVPFFHGGSIGVDVFFVLSGFVITTVLWRGTTQWGAFLRRRVVRLYPALLGLVVVSVALYAVTPWAPVGPADVARRGLIALTQTSSAWAATRSGSMWLPGLEPFGQTWSLAVEWYFYALWPLLVLRARAADWSAARLAAVSLAAAAAAYALAVPLPTFAFYFGPVERCAELLVGAALGLWLVDHPPTPRRTRVAPVVALAAVIGYAVIGTDAQTWGYRYVGVPLAVAGAVLLIRAGYAGPGPAQRVLSHRWLTGLGRVSYSLYLWHLLPFVLLADAPLPKPALGLLAVAAAAVLTWASHRLLERPFLRPRSELLRMRRPGRPDPELRPSPAPLA
ncbi:acyltransferase family protein [Nocardioides mangrovi]|uniref:Acyltransferase n=1 Tax=Nocardioides mangrovi TaxID=2874580 RepID=A0ABS7U9M6_9ACTN|nr:acyltransferase [Nocardioides mangrovi]MBZ5737656.1 acyltransferase [Nocardioides mangrovi]